MASMIDSIKNIVGDSHPYYKMLFLTAIVYGAYKIYSPEYIPLVVKIIVIALVALYCSGYLLVTLHNTVGEKHYLMPNCFYVIQIFGAAFKGILLLLPGFLTVTLVLYALHSFLAFEFYINYIIMAITLIILISVIALQFLFFAKRLSLKDALNFKAISNFAGDFVVQTIALVLYLTILGALLAGSIGLILYTIFGWGELVELFIAFLAVFLSLSAVQFYAQLYFEFIDILSSN